MTVAWDAVETACAAWAAAVLPGVPVIWRDQPKTHVVAPYVELSIDGERSYGLDDVEYIDGTDTLTPKVTGAREFTLEVSCRSRDQGALRAARNNLERLRASLQHQAYVVLLEAGGLAVHTSEPLRTIPFAHEGRRESLAVLEIKLGVTSELFDADASVDYAETATVVLAADGDEFTVDLGSPLSGQVVTDLLGVVITDANGVVLTWL